MVRKWQRWDLARQGARTSTTTESDACQPKQAAAHQLRQGEAAALGGAAGTGSDRGQDNASPRQGQADPGKVTTVGCADFGVSSVRMRASQPPEVEMPQQVMQGRSPRARTGSSKQVGTGADPEEPTVVQLLQGSPSRSRSCEMSEQQDCATTADHEPGHREGGSRRTHGGRGGIQWPGGSSNQGASDLRFPGAIQCRPRNHQDPETKSRASPSRRSPRPHSRSWTPGVCTMHYLRR